MIILLHIILAGVLLYCAGLLGKISTEYISITSFNNNNDDYPSFNFIYRVLFPVVAIFILGYIFTIFGIPTDNIWHISIFYVVWRFLYITIMGRWNLTSYNYIIFASILQICLSYFVYKIFNVDKKFFIPSNESLVSEFWIIIILYLYKVFNNINIYKKSNYRKRKRENKYIINKFREFYKLYNYNINNIIKHKNYNDEQKIIVKRIIFSVMILENFNRPKILRIIERLCKAKTTGIMQYTSIKMLSDIESVKEATNFICDTFDIYISKENKFNELRAIEYVVMRYNSGEHYFCMIYNIYTCLDNMLPQTKYVQGD